MCLRHFLAFGRGRIFRMFASPWAVRRGTWSAQSARGSCAKCRSGSSLVDSVLKLICQHWAYDRARRPARWKAEDR